MTRKKRYYPREWDGDPRDYLDPHYRPFISDEAVELWRLNHWCLCGCQEETQLRSGRYKDIPSRTYHFFHKYHQWRVADVRTGRVNTPEHRRNISRGLKAANMDTRGLGFVIDEYLEAHPEENLKTLAIKIGMSRTQLTEIRNYTCKSIRKRTFVKILVGCEEPVRRELRSAA